MIKHRRWDKLIQVRKNPIFMFYLHIYLNPKFTLTIIVAFWPFLSMQKIVGYTQIYKKSVLTVSYWS